jgi:exodeoxyribonuclease-3
MRKLKVATWNINSIRLRFEQVKKVFQEQNIDILALQEIKVINELFPLDACNQIGAKYCYFNGEKSYNGVAFLSRIPLDEAFYLKLCKDDARHIAVRVDDKIELHNFYVPSGGDEPDISINPKFAHKLQYLEEMKSWFATNRKASDKMMLMGDLNIAPFEHDVWSSKQLRNVVSHTIPEIERLNAIRENLNWIDVSRKFVPLDKKLYSWWSYRNPGWRENDKGRRLDQIWCTKPLDESIINSTILKETREYTQPSDHVPVICEVII